MNKPEQDLDLENLRADWQHGSASLPEISVTQLRRRLRWRWMGIVVDVLTLVAVGALLTWMALNASGLAVWIYWGFFAAVYVLSVRSACACAWRACGGGMNLQQRYSTTPGATPACASAAVGWGF